MMTLVRWEIWQRRWSTLAWSLGTIIYILLITSVYKSFVRGQTLNLGQTIQNLPDTLKSFINVTADFRTPAGFLGSEPYYVVLPIIFIVLAATLGSSLLAREESSGTLELLLARPVSRARLLAAKALSGMLILAAVDILSGAAMTLFTKIFNMDIAIGPLWKAQLMLYLLALVFGALAFALTAVGRAGRSAASGITMLLAIGGYVLTSLEAGVHWVKWPAKLLPYHYYNPSQILSGTLTKGPAIGYLICAIVFGFIAWLAFRRRDLAGS